MALLGLLPPLLVSVTFSFVICEVCGTKYRKAGIILNPKKETIHLDRISKEDTNLAFEKTDMIFFCKCKYKKLGMHQELNILDFLLRLIVPILISPFPQCQGHIPSFNIVIFSKDYA